MQKKKIKKSTPKKLLIKVYDYPEDPSIFPKSYSVRAWCVGGKEGVFATFKDPRPGRKKCIVFAAGDDGHWWFSDAYDKFWIPEIVKALQNCVKGSKK